MVNYIIQTCCSTTIVIMGIISLSRKKIEKEAEKGRQVAELYRVIYLKKKIEEE